MMTVYYKIDDSKMPLTPSAQKESVQSQIDLYNKRIERGDLGSDAWEDLRGSFKVTAAQEELTSVTSLCINLTEKISEQDDHPIVSERCGAAVGLVSIINLLAGKLDLNRRERWERQMWIMLDSVKDETGCMKGDDDETRDE